MVEYQKENELSLQMFIDKEKNLNQAESYEKELLKSKYENNIIVFYISIIIFIITFISVCLINPLGNSIYVQKDAGSLFLAYLIMSVVAFSVSSLISIFAISLFENLFNPIQNYKQNKFKKNYLNINGNIPDFEKEQIDYCNFVSNKETRLFLINEIDKSLLMAEHYKVKNIYVTHLEELKESYIAFNLKNNDISSFNDLNKKIIYNLGKFNNYIDELAENNFYTEYINVDSQKPTISLNIFENTTKYREIL